MILKFRNSLFFLLLLLPVITVAFFVSKNALPAFSGSSFTVVLDAGHGAPG